tara:strand:+ start:559 stop:687 length:129 start_codon:yes stop_codon:yes gene_type:complete
MLRDEIINNDYSNVSQIIYEWQQKMLSIEEYKYLKDKYNIYD